MYIDTKILKLLIGLSLYSILALIIQFACLNDILFMNYIVPIISFISIISCIINYIINPGIIYSSNKYNEKVYCSECKLLYPKTSKKVVHCNICKICIQGLDHHCGFIGKCVGKINMVIFLILYFSGMAFIICSIVIFVFLIS